MKRLLATSLAALTLVACSGSPTGPAGSGSPEELATPDAPYYAKPGTGIDGELHRRLPERRLGAARHDRGKLLRLGGTRKFSYARALTGFAAALPPGAIALLRADPDVAFIEQDGLVQASAIQSNAPWARSHRPAYRPLSGRYSYHASGAGVTAYVIDTGIETTHPQFGGRATVAYDGVGDGRNGQDCNGHGTHVAGIIGSATYGVAKGVALRAVRVLDCTGSGPTSAVIAGMNWVAANHVPTSVANVSLGGGYSRPPTRPRTTWRAAACSSRSRPATRPPTPATITRQCGERDHGRRIHQHRQPRQSTRTTAAAWTCTRRARASRPPGSTAARTPQRHVDGDARGDRSGRALQGDPRRRIVLDRSHAG